MEEKRFCVYIHENKINHKKYVGMTGKDPEQRWRDGKNYQTCVAFRRAIEKYGWDNFEHIIQFSGLTYEEACAKEIEQIASYQTQDPEFGYNICAGGGGMIGFHHTEETKELLRQKMSGEKNPNFGKKQSQEQIELLRQCNIGRKHTEEHKRKIGDALRGRHYSTDKQKEAARVAHVRPVVREDGVVFASVTAAAESIGVCYSAISNSIRRNQRCGGYKWKYVESKA